MKSLFKKSLLVLMVAFIAVISLGVTNKVVAASLSVDWTKASYSSASTSKVTWDADQFSIVLEKSSSQTNANNYLGGTNAHTRIYKSQILTFIIGL